MPGLGARLGRGGATTFEQDIEKSDCIVVMGSNMAENHPIAFRFALHAREAGARLIHVDPRFSRTSALADTFVRIRSGTDIAFLGGLINYVISHEKYFHEYVLHYTNASRLVDERYQDTEDLAGLFSGFDPDSRQYTVETWQYASQPGAVPPLTDETLQDPRCVFQITKRHFSRYTPEMVSDICGCGVEDFLAVAGAITENSGRDRTTVLCYAMGWAQHTVGVQTIGAATLLQLLLGNIGRPGGGILALRGHATIQGSTDIPTLYNLLPGYLPQPSTIQGHFSLGDYLRIQTPRTGWWNNLPKYMISLLKAWYGEEARPDNDFGYDWLPKIGADYSVMPMVQAFSDGPIKGLFCLGQNPAVGAQDAHLVRTGLANLDWLVFRDMFETETAAFWKSSPEIKRGELRTEDVKTEVFLLPAAVAAEKDGTFTNTMRLVQWHDRAVEPPGDARSETWFLYHLGKRLKELYAGSQLPRDRALQALTWDYPTAGPQHEPEVSTILKEINGRRLTDNSLVATFGDLEDDGSTSCGCWIYSGIHPTEDHNRARDRTGDDWVSPDWGFAWPANRRILYNRASADPSGKPWSERKKFVWWDHEKGEWTGYDVPDFPLNKAPDTVANPDGTGLDAHSGADPYIMMTDGRAWLFVPSGLCDGPLPVHYEPVESPVENALYPEQRANPMARLWPRAENRYISAGDDEYPYAITTYRLTEHHTAGGMSRFLPWLAELQPRGFVEISVELAAELGIKNGEWVVVETPRYSAEAQALVTERMKPMRIRRRLVHQVGMPWHFGWQGLATGGIANNLTALAADPNVTIHESKAFMCNLRRRDGQ